LLVKLRALQTTTCPPHGTAQGGALETAPRGILAERAGYSWRQANRITVWAGRAGVCCRRGARQLWPVPTAARAIRSGAATQHGMGRRLVGQLAGPAGPARHYFRRETKRTQNSLLNKWATAHIPRFFRNRPNPAHWASARPSTRLACCCLLSEKKEDETNAGGGVICTPPAQLVLLIYLHSTIHSLLHAVCICNTCSA
jgi:hypothetical protein